ncbi:NAC domain-containing protein 68 isoform X2 [Spinacia oleracea]|uniref:NAC domain-containing protein 68 isoform X2 n=1 Tax=Spinacia oleracea TaxID=3562 RepID=A0ABM3QS00_SPIOL|nr:NAC domain-containing protein 68-like isoform X2 [Spinacia oleracea]
MFSTVLTLFMVIHSPSEQRKEVDDASLQPQKPDENANASSCDSRSARQKEVGNTSSSDADLEKRILLDEITGYVQEIPIGFKFKPKDHVIIGDYLRKKVANCPLPIPSDMIQDISASDFYKKHPKDIDVLDQREWFFYIKRDGIKFEDYKIREVVDGVGNWQPLQPFGTSKSSVQDLKGETIGYKLSFRFFRKSAESSKRTHWKMDVYELTEQDTEWAMARVEKGIEYRGE